MAYRFTPSKQSKLNELSAIDLSGLGANQILGSLDGSAIGPVAILDMLPSGTEGQVIKFSGGSWGAADAAVGVSAMRDLSDASWTLGADSSDPDSIAADGLVIKWDHASKSFVLGADMTGGGGAAVLNDLSDVSAAGLTVADSGKALVYIDGGSGGSWSAQGPFLAASADAAAVTAALISNWDSAFAWGDHSTAGYALSASVPTVLSSLGDVDSTAVPAPGDVLAWDGTASNWTAVTPPAASGEAYITIDVSVTPGAGGPDFVTYNQHPASTLSVLQGMTYRFDLSDANCTGYTWAFSKVADGTNADPSEPDFDWTTASVGTPGQPGAYLEIRISASWPYVDVPKLYIYMPGHPNFYTGLNIIRGWERAAGTSKGKVLSYAGSSIGASWADPSLVETVDVTVESVFGTPYLRVNGGTVLNFPLIPGVTYRFDQSDSSNATHQIAFSASGADGHHAGGGQWMAGVTEEGTPGEPGAYTLVEITESTPDLYFYCESHAGMGQATPLYVQKQLPHTAGSGDVLTWSGSSWNPMPASGGSSADSRYIGDGPGAGCASLLFNAGFTSYNAVHSTGSSGGDIWLMCRNQTGAPATVVLPDIDNTECLGRRFYISDCQGLAESEKIIVTVAGPAGGTPGQIDGLASEDIFDGASLTVMCTGQRVDPADATTGLIWKIV